MFAIGVAVFSPTVLLPSFLQQLQGYSPTQAGDADGSPRRLGDGGDAARGTAGRPRRPAHASSARRLLGRRLAVDDGRGSASTRPPPGALAGMLQGFGAPLTFVPLTVAAYSTLAAAQRAEAGVMLTLIRNIGASVGISRGGRDAGALDPGEPRAISANISRPTTCSAGRRRAWSRANAVRRMLRARSGGRPRPSLTRTISTCSR